jgi:hypothetical protein
VLLRLRLLLLLLPLKSFQVLLPLVILLFLPLAEGGKRELTQDLQACVVKHNEKDSTHALAGFDGRR